MPSPESPPYTITPAILSLVAEIVGGLARIGAISGSGNVPTLRRANRIRSIHASLAIENNTLTLDQVTAVIAGKRVLGPPDEIQEVRNAFATYEAMPDWSPTSSRDLLAAHKLMLRGLADDAGRFRSGAVGIAQGSRVVHLAPPAGRVPGLVKNLLAWLRGTDAHPLVASSVFHYELEFIHPFSDGNGRLGRFWQTLILSGPSAKEPNAPSAARLGRFWQTLILSRWNPLLAWLPVESVIHARQADYYRVLASCDQAGNSTAFIEFLLSALLQALRDATGTDPVGDPVTDQVAALLRLLGKTGPLAVSDAMKRLKLAHRPTFRANYLRPAIAAGFVEPTLPDKPNSRLQKYRLTDRGRMRNDK